MVSVREINLCEVCLRAREGLFDAPAHLVHPEEGTAERCDLRGEAVCPACGALWIREQHKARLADLFP